MASSHQVKRFLNGFTWTRVFLFRRLLQTLFLWRLQITKPDVIELGIDTMVMDNDDALCRKGVKPTYKKISTPADKLGPLHCRCGFSRWGQALQFR
jgi:hypothetical protein